MMDSMYNDAPPRVIVAIANARGPYAKLYEKDGLYVVETPEGYHRFGDQGMAMAMYVAISAAFEAGRAQIK